MYHVGDLQSLHTFNLIIIHDTTTEWSMEISSQLLFPGLEACGRKKKWRLEKWAFL